MAFEIGTLVRFKQGDSNRHIGRVTAVRDYGIEIWVDTLGPPSQVRQNPRYYTYYDQLEEVSFLDLLADPPDWWPEGGFLDQRS